MNERLFQKTILRLIEMRRIAYRLLEIDESAVRNEIKRAWRVKCLETHPDNNKDDSDAHRKFRLINCAYRLLAEGIPCEELLTCGDDDKGEEQTANSKYNRSNSWGYHLWWKENFF